VIAELTLAAALVLTGGTDEGRPVQVEMSRARVTRVKGSVLAYDCEDFGDVGPRRFDVRVPVRANKVTGRFAFVTGDGTERIGISGYRRQRGTIVRARVRISGTIATGQRCASPNVRFTAR
jgi:hypothetical protein